MGGTIVYNPKNSGSGAIGLLIHYMGYEAAKGLNTTSGFCAAEYFCLVILRYL
jgi:hypothetical protein